MISCMNSPMAGPNEKPSCNTFVKTLAYAAAKQLDQAPAVEVLSPSEHACTSARANTSATSSMKVDAWPKAKDVALVRSSTHWQFSSASAVAVAWASAVERPQARAVASADAQPKALPSDVHEAWASAIADATAKAAPALNSFSMSLMGPWKLGRQPMAKASATALMWASLAAEKEEEDALAVHVTLLLTQSFVVTVLLPSSPYKARQLISHFIVSTVRNGSSMMQQQRGSRVVQVRKSG
jgi:hypothetical protein